MNSLRILDMNPVSDTRFADIFSHSVGGLLTLVMGPFAVQKLYSLMESRLPIAAFGLISRKSRPEPTTKLSLYAFFQDFYSFKSSTS